jgi:ABC-type Na+ transport system ATPase subunit NatA
LKITGFTIKNFKGIESASIRFAEHDTARVHTLVGLNESGKTTLLEAIHSFSPDIDTEIVVQGASSRSEQREQWVPRDQFSIFTGEVSVTAHIEAEGNDWKAFCRDIRNDMRLVINEEVLPKEFTLRLAHEYRNGDYVKTTLHASLPGLKVKTKQAKNFRDPRPKEKDELSCMLRRHIPTIAYYPTFVFDFPDRVFLTNRDNSPKNRFYRQLFQDILDFTGTGYTIEDSIIARLHRQENRGPWDIWFNTWSGTTEEAKAKQVVSRAERAVTNVVFSKWNDVFGEAAGGKKVQIILNYEKGKPIKHEDGSEEEATIHDAYIQFRILDGPDPYAVEDRSLGFRWFFCFLLFTQFRLHREGSKPTIFLFDEPASNLHAAAQMKLLESFPEIGKAPHRLIYSTHSHYMVEPKWLEQTYIVYNNKVDPDGGIIDTGFTDQSDIRAIPYRAFVQEYPNKTSYFQPIIDTLRVIPSKFDYQKPGLIVEGKNDYYGIRLAASVESADSLNIFPGMGSGTLGALVALHKGWGLKVDVLFDNDKGGKDGRKHLRMEFALQDESIHFLSDFSPELNKVEDLFSDHDKNKLTEGHQTHKSVLNRRVQEILASGEDYDFSDQTKNNMKTLIQGIRSVLGV